MLDLDGVLDLRRDMSALMEVNAEGEMRVAYGKFFTHFGRADPEEPTPSGVIGASTQIFPRIFLSPVVDKSCGNAFPVPGAFFFLLLLARYGTFADLDLAAKEGVPSEVHSLDTNLHEPETSNAFVSLLAQATSACRTASS